MLYAGVSGIQQVVIFPYDTDGTRAIEIRLLCGPLP